MKRMHFILIGVVILIFFVGLVSLPSDDVEASVDVTNQLSIYQGSSLIPSSINLVTYPTIDLGDTVP